jgi:hypothetical protein
MRARQATCRRAWRAPRQQRRRSRVTHATPPVPPPPHHPPAPNTHAAATRRHRRKRLRTAAGRTRSSRTRAPWRRPSRQAARTPRRPMRPPSPRPLQVRRARARGRGRAAQCAALASVRCTARHARGAGSPTCVGRLRQPPLQPDRRAPRTYTGPVCVCVCVCVCACVRVCARCRAHGAPALAAGGDQAKGLAAAIAVVSCEGGASAEAFSQVRRRVCVVIQL